MVRVTWTRSRWTVLLTTSFSFVALASWPLRSADLRPDYQPSAYAIKGARVVTEPGTTIELGTVVIRNGVIQSVGPVDKITIPYDAETIDGKGLTLYPGFIDLYTNIGQPTGITRSQTGTGRTINYADFALPSTPPDNRAGITPEFQVASVLDLTDDVAGERRTLGFTDLIAAPAGSIATGQSVLVSLAGQPRRESVVRSPIALHLNVRPPSDPTAAVATPAPTPISDENPAQKKGQQRRGGGFGTRAYPSSLMGAVAHLRQAMIDAEHNHLLHSYYSESGGPRPPFDPALKALHDARAKTLPVWWEANTRDEIHRALDLAEEFGTSCVIVGGKEAGKAVDRLKRLDVPVVFRLDFPEEPKAPTEAEYRRKDVSDRDEPLRVLENKVATWQEWVATARTLEKGGVRFGFSSEGVPKSQTVHGQVRKLLAAGLSKDAALDALTRQAATISGVGDRLGTIAVGKLGHVVAWTGPIGDDRAKARYVFIDGQKFDLEKTAAAAKKKGGGRGGFGARAKGEDEPKKDAPPKDQSASKKDTPAKEQPAPKKDAPAATKEQEKAATPEDQPKEPKPFVDVAAEFEATRKPKVQTGGNVLIKNATVLTGTKERGNLPRASILVKDGKIAAVGEDLNAPEGVTVIEAEGLVAMPGIIDTHSHMAIQGGVNEGSLSITPEVRVKDVVTGEDPTIYRALAGGTTTARLLHGSANTIGGQDAVIKLRHGRPGRELLLKGNPQGVKFALGENVTRSAGRFPNTRMGVEATIERAFEEAQVYRDAWKTYESEKSKGNAGPPPRRDLRLEALAGVLDGSIRVHCHCYRSDEILMLLNVCERHGVRVRSLQHVLEGYKVAAEIAAHGASASTFSDWWAYKVEAKDAIPYNAGLLTQAGASVCIKSDSEELVRHLNLEAAKMLKYGGVREEDALAMVTLNPARELGLDARIGTIEVGKDADIALFNGHPFNAFTHCEYTLIDGEVWFQKTPGEAGAPSTKLAGTLPKIDVSNRDKPLPIATNPRQVYALVGASVHPVTGPEISNGTVIVSEGKIVALGGPDTSVPADAQKVDLQGYDLWPGLVDAGSTLGLMEISSLRETMDASDSAQFQPELHTGTALHPDSEIIPVTRANGVLTTYVHPTGGTISGQGCVIGLDGWVPREMVLADHIALDIIIPRYVPQQTLDNPRFAMFAAASGVGADANARRKERLDEIKEQFQRALAYHDVRKKATAAGVAALPADPRLDALIPYALGEKPVIFHAEQRTEILDAIKLAKELKLKAIISGGRDAWKVADVLKESGIPVLIAGMLRLPALATDPYDALYANPARLHAAGVAFAIRSKDADAEAATAPRNLPYEAATAVAFGLPEDIAVKAVTITPAQILGIADKVGSIEVGKRANLVVSLGHILQPSTEIKALFVNGKPLSPASRQSHLYEQYRKRLADVKAGVAPLGIDGRLSTPPSRSVPPAGVGSDPAAGGDASGSRGDGRR
jgi:imidazolonepropionase-like amidohydrolase